MRRQSSWPVSLLVSTAFVNRFAPLTECPKASKHWPHEKQVKLWAWFTPYIKKVFGQTTNEMISIWTSFLEVCPISHSLADSQR